MRIPCCIFIFLMVASNAHSAALYKCSGPKNAISIQSAPCPKGSKQIWMRDGTPETPLTAQQIDAQHAKRRQDDEAARNLSRMAGTAQRNDVVVHQNNSYIDARKQRCDSAKRQALQIRERDWKKLTFDALQKLDAWVESQCK